MAQPYYHHLQKIILDLENDKAAFTENRDLVLLLQHKTATPLWTVSWCQQPFSTVALISASLFSQADVHGDLVFLNVRLHHLSTKLRLIFSPHKRMKLPQRALHYRLTGTAKIICSVFGNSETCRFWSHFTYSYIENNKTHILLHIYICWSLKRPFKVSHREAKHSAAADMHSAEVSTNTPQLTTYWRSASVTQTSTCKCQFAFGMFLLISLRAVCQQVFLLFHPLSTSASRISIWNTMLDQIASVLRWSTSLQWIKRSPNCFYAQQERKFSEGKQ